MAKMDIDVYAVVKKLIGSIEPVGSQHVDNERLENLKVHIDLTAALLHDIQCVRQNKDRQEYSMKEIGQKADEFLTDYFGGAVNWQT